jgi:K+-transporting ATPase A subunit
MANEPAAREATPLVTTLVVEVVVGVGRGWVKRLVMVVCAPPVAVVERLPRMVEVMVELVEVEVMSVEVWLPAVVVVVVSVAVAVPVPMVVVEESPPSPPAILKGKLYWKTEASDSSVIMMP